MLSELRNGPQRQAVLCSIVSSQTFGLAAYNGQQQAEGESQAYHSAAYNGPQRQAVLCSIASSQPFGRAAHIGQQTAEAESQA